MKNPLRCAIVGCGVIGPVHAESYLRLPGVEVAWACDLQEDRARRLAEKFGVPRITTDFREVLADPAVDAVSICTDHASHPALVEAALAAGKPVLCEKALAASPAGLEAMLAAHRRHPQVIFGGVLQHRFDPVYRMLRRLVRENAFGTLLSGHLQLLCLRTDEYYRSDAWRGTWAGEGGSVLINQAIHFVDALQWIMGGALAVSAQIANRTHPGVIETEDTAVACLRFPDGVMGTLFATASSHIGWEPSLGLYGSAGTIEVRDGQVRSARFTDPARQAAVEAEVASFAEARQTQAGKDYYGPSHPTQIADFVEAIRQGRPPFVTAVDAAEPVRLVLALYRAHREGRWVEV